jgi:hypothetical protein
MESSDIYMGAYNLDAGLSVRCFKNTYTPSDNLHTITFDFNG